MTQLILAFVFQFMHQECRNAYTNPTEILKQIQDIEEILKFFDTFIPKQRLKSQSSLYFVE